MRIPFTKYGWLEILLFTGVFGFGAYAGLAQLGGAGGVVAAILSIGSWLFVMNFFRDPNRPLPEGEGVIVSPADGKVTDILEVKDVPFVEGHAVRIGIFLSVFDVHVNRSPLAGEVAYKKHRPGGYLDARDPACADLNEAQDIGLMVTASGGERFPVLVRQIAGLVARRIVCPVAIGAQLAAGERYGMIKVGSRTEIYLPIDRLKSWEVKVGDMVKGGQTALGFVELGKASEAKNEESLREALRSE